MAISMRCRLKTACSIASRSIDRDRPFAHPHRLPCDAHGFEPAIAHIRLHHEIAGPAHLVALLQHEAIYSVLERSADQELARKKSGRRAGRRILSDARA